MPAQGLTRPPQRPKWTDRNREVNPSRVGTGDRTVAAKVGQRNPVPLRPESFQPGTLWPRGPDVLWDRRGREISGERVPRQTRHSRHDPGRRNGEETERTFIELETDKEVTEARF